VQALIFGYLFIKKKVKTCPVRTKNITTTQNLFRSGCEGTDNGIKWFLVIRTMLSGIANDGRLGG